MAFARHLCKALRLTASKCGFMCAIYHHICIALREAGADSNIKIAGGGVVKDAGVVSPTIYDEDKIAVDVWAAAGASIRNGGGCGVNAAGARVGRTRDGTGGGVSHGKPGRQSCRTPEKWSYTAGDAQRHGEWQSLPRYFVKGRVDCHVTYRGGGYDIYGDSIHIKVWSASGWRKLGDAKNKPS